jgi:hypothetical protein
LEQNNIDNPFLGGLKSELDEGFTLDAIFNKLIAVADNIRNRYVKFEISGEQAATLFKKLRVTDSSNTEWTVGPSSGSWYIKNTNSTTWFQSAPPVGIEIVNSESYNFDQLVIHEEFVDKKSVNNAGVKIEDYTIDTDIDHISDKNWLYEEWNLLEIEMVSMQDKAKLLAANNSSIDNIEAPLEKDIVSNYDDNDATGLPDTQPINIDDNFNLDDFFVKPENREQDVVDNETNSNLVNSNEPFSTPPTDQPDIK